MHSHTHQKRRMLPFALALATAFACGAAQAVVTDADILNDAKTPGDVVSFGMGTQGQRYSPMTQINTKNVKNLVPVWSMSFGGEKQRGQESQPVIHNGKMFVTASYSRLFAVDAKTGKKLWKYEHRLPDGIMPCCDVINRGAAYSLTAAPISAKGKLISGVAGGECGIGGRVDAREPLTGKLLWTRPTV